MVTDHLAGGVLERLAPANVDAYAGVKLECLAAGSDFGAAKHHTHFFAQLIGENAGGLGFAHDGGEFAEGLAHQPRLHPHSGHAHVAFELGFGDERGNGVDDDDVQRAGAREGFANGKGFLAAVGLGHEEVIEVHAEFFGVLGIERVLGINEGAQAASFLSVGDDVQHHGRFAGGFRTINFHDAALGHAANAEGEVEGKRAR